MQSAPVTPYTRQQLFDIALNGIRRQGRLSSSVRPPGAVPSTGCYYRHPLDPSIRCAIGHAIPDDIYDPDFDTHFNGGSGVCTLIEHYPAIAALFGHDESFCLDLQSAHDYAWLGREATMAEELNQFERNMCKLAERYGLTYTPPPVPTPEPQHLTHVNSENT